MNTARLVDALRAWVDMAAPRDLKEVAQLGAPEFHKTAESAKIRVCQARRRRLVCDAIFDGRGPPRPILAAVACDRPSS